MRSCVRVRDTACPDAAAWWCGVVGSPDVPGRVCVFCDKLNFTHVASLLKHARGVIKLGVHKGLAPLMIVPGLSVRKARRLFSVGLTRVRQVANHPIEVCSDAVRRRCWRCDSQRACTRAARVLEGLGNDLKGLNRVPCGWHELNVPDWLHNPGWRRPAGARPEEVRPRPAPGARAVS